MISCREEIILLRKQIKALSIQLRTEGHDIAEQVPLGAMISTSCSNRTQQLYQRNRLPIDRYQRPGPIPIGRRP